MFKVILFARNTTNPGPFSDGVEILAEYESDYLGDAFEHAELRLSELRDEKIREYSTQHVKMLGPRAMVTPWGHYWVAEV